MTFWDWNQYKDLPLDVKVCPVCFAMLPEPLKELHREWHEERGEEPKT